jgi:hypothetical protein
MKSEKKYMVIGIFIGIVLSFFYFQYFAPRFEMKKEGLTLIKVDKWTGDSWRFVDDNWKKMADMDENWEKIAQALREAPNGPSAEVDPRPPRAPLREKYLILKDISDEELLERIKLVYSKQVLTSMYLDNFLAKDQVKEANP